MAKTRTRSGQFARGNPGGKLKQARRAHRVHRRDGWANILTKVGTRSDKRTGARFSLRKISDRQARDLWRQDDIAGRIVETIPKESFRRKFDLKADLDKKVIDDVVGVLEDLKVRAVMTRAASIERALGGAAIYPVINDGAGNLKEPLNESRIPEVTRLQVLEPRELQPTAYYTDINDPKFGMPSVYRLQPIMVRGGSPLSAANVEIHESRLVVFPGLRFSRDDVGTTLGWGDSVLQRVYDVLADYELGVQNGAALLSDFSQGVLKLKDFYEMIATADSDDAVAERLNTIMLAKSVIGNLVIDADDDYSRTPTPIDGMADMIDRLEWRLAAASDMPRTLLMGQPPSGLGATGASDIQFFYDRVDSAREEQYVDPLERIVYLVLRSAAGPTNGIEPANWAAEFCALYKPTDKELVDARFVQAQIDEIYFNMGSVSAEEIRKNRYEGDSYSIETHVEGPAPTPPAPVVPDPTLRTVQGAQVPGTPTPPAGA